jgi:hypothetical protein
MALTKRIDAMAEQERTPPEPGSAESLGLTKPVPPVSEKDPAAEIDEKGEPFDDNFA